ncbi:MAG: hypothetical protein GY950_03080 [bacterium]|nr:hypothetical protein [bacterium]
MNLKKFYDEIEDIQKQSKSMDYVQFQKKLSCYIRIHPWRSPLIYGYLYTSGIYSHRIISFFAKKTLEAIENVCEQRIEKDNKKFENTKNSTDNKTSQIARTQLDQLLISLTILILAFEIPEQSDAINDLEKRIWKKLKDINIRFIDKLPLNVYLKLLKNKFQQNEKAFKPLKTFFYHLIQNAGLDKSQSLEHQATNFKKNIERLIEETGNRIEKPDRIFSYVESLDEVTHFANSLFDSEELRGKVSLKYKWDYSQSNSIEELKVFWVTSMTGLFAFTQAFDSFSTSSQKTEKIQKEITLSQTQAKEKSAGEGEKISQEGIKKPKQSFFTKRKSRKNFMLKPVFAFQ